MSKSPTRSSQVVHVVEMNETSIYLHQICPAITGLQEIVLTVEQTAPIMSGRERKKIFVP